MILAGLIWYGKTYYPGITLSLCLTDPERYDGQFVEVGNGAIVQDISSNGFIIKQMGKQIKVQGNSENVIAGKYIYLYAIFHSPGWLEAKKIHVADKRQMKIWISILPIVVILFYFFKTFRFNLKNCKFTERR